MEKRNEIQKIASDHIVENKFKGILFVAPRVGKCKIIIDALNCKTKELSVLVVAPRKEIFKGWKIDIKKWKLRKDVHIDYVWSNSLKKIDKKYDLIIADEIHDYNMKVLHELLRHKKMGTRILGATGTLDPDTKFTIKQILDIDVFYSYSINEAIKDKIVSDYEIRCIECNLDEKDKYIVSGSEEFQFLQTEREAYSYWDRKYANALARQAYSQMRFPMMKRKEIIYNSRTKVNLTQLIIDKVDRCLIFTGYQKIADSLGEAAYHSKSDKTVLDKLINGDINKVAVVSMVSMGVTVANLKTVIFNQLKSGENTAIQQSMRAMNIENDKKAIIYVVYLKNTRDEEWMKSAIKGFDQNKIKYLKINEI